MKYILNVCYLWSFNSFVPSRHDVLRMTKTKSEKARGMETFFPWGVDSVKDRTYELKFT